MSDEAHRDLILDQFTRQAVPFSSAPGLRDQQALGLVIDFATVGPHDTVLDVACGPGLLVCALARTARHVTGIDLTPAMLVRARAEAASQHVGNASWVRGDVTVLPFKDETFSAVTTRFSFHHLLEPRAALEEMKRVCRRGGRIVVADSAPATDKAGAFNRLEKLRDPSHVRALPLDELRALFIATGLGEPRTTGYRLESTLEALLSRSFPAPGDVKEIRRIFADAVERDDPDINAYRDRGDIRYGYPVAVLVAQR